MCDGRKQQEYARDSLLPFLNGLIINSASRVRDWQRALCSVDTNLQNDPSADAMTHENEVNRRVISFPQCIDYFNDSLYLRMEATICMSHGGDFGRMAEHRMCKNCDRVV